jgi:SSS family solute:Na+ symporter
MMGNPFGIDNAYVALVVPLIIMGLSSMAERIRTGKIMPVSVEVADEIKNRASSSR